MQKAMTESHEEGNKPDFEWFDQLLMSKLVE